MTSSRILCVGIVGLGKIAETRHLPLLARHPVLRVTAACDIDAARAHHIAAKFSIPQIVADAQTMFDASQVDLVAIFTPPTTHAALAHAALKAGKHVFVEKPLTLALDDAHTLVEQVERTGKKVFVGFNQRRHRLVQQARHWLHENRLGQVSALRTTLTNNHDPAQRDGWQSIPARGGDLNFEVGVHHYDLWRYLLQDEIASVYAQRTCRADNAETLTLIAKTRSGIPITAALVEATNEQNSLEIFGARGRIALTLYRFDGLEFTARGEFDGSISARAKRARDLIVESGLIARRTASGGDYELCYAEEWDHVASHLDSPVAYEPNVYDGLAATQIALAVRQSINMNAPVTVPPLTRGNNF